MLNLIAITLDFIWWKSSSINNDPMDFVTKSNFLNLRRHTCIIYIYNPLLNISPSINLESYNLSHTIQITIMKGVNNA